MEAPASASASFRTGKLAVYGRKLVDKGQCWQQKRRESSSRVEKAVILAVYLP